MSIYTSWQATFGFWDELLFAMGRIIDGIDIEGEVLGRRCERSDELIDKSVTQAFQRGDGDGIFKAGQRGLAGQGFGIGRSVGDELEDRIVPQGVVIVLVFVSREDTENSRAHHFEEAVVA